MYMGYHIMPTLYDMEKDKTVWRGEFVCFIFIYIDLYVLMEYLQGSPKFYGLKQKQFFTDFQFMPDSASVMITGSRYREV